MFLGTWQQTQKSRDNEMATLTHFRHLFRVFQGSIEIDLKRCPFFFYSNRIKKIVVQQHTMTIGDNSSKMSTRLTLPCSVAFKNKG